MGALADAQQVLDDPIDVRGALPGPPADPIGQAKPPSAAVIAGDVRSHDELEVLGDRKSVV